MAEGEPLLSLRGITKHFPGVQALRGVDFDLHAGEVHALMGQNGAGKSTLIKVLTGVHPADAGEMRLQGQSIRPTTPRDAQALGIRTVYQEVNLCPNLSVAENVYAGRFPRYGAARGFAINWSRVNDEARAALARLQLSIDVTQRLSSFSVAVQQMVAIARALVFDARVLVLDEPTSSLDEDEVERLFALLRRLRDDGLGLIFVTHFLDQVYALADRITVLRNGERVGVWPASALPAGALVAAMVGRELAEAPQRRQNDGAAARAAEHAAPLLEASGLGRRGQLKATDLALRSGEVLGLAGLLGSGRTELARLLFGLDRPDAGTLVIDGQPVVLHDPSQAVRLGLALCPEDRKAEGIVAELSLRENIALALQARRGVWRCIGRREQTALAQRYIQALGIKAADVDTPIGQLSGGNQQKALLARWLATEPRLLILDEPTRGIDVAAKQEIMAQILALAADGMAVLFISSEIDEVVRVSDRIAVMRDRRKQGELPGGSSEADVVELIAQVA